MNTLSTFFNNAGNFGDLLLNKFFDKKYVIKTCGIIPTYDIHTSHSSIKNAKNYQGTHYRLINKVLTSLDINYEEFEFLDIGSGKGRVLFSASFYPFKKCIGVEFGENLYSDFKRNLAKFNTKYPQQGSKIECHLQDILHYPIENHGPLVCFLYNPFDEKILDKCLKKFENMNNRLAKKSIFIYVNPLRKFVFTRYGYEKIFEIPNTNHNKQVHVYS